MNIESDQIHNKDDQDRQNDSIKNNNQAPQLQIQTFETKHLKQQKNTPLNETNTQEIDSDDENLKQISRNELQLKGVVGLKNLVNTSFMNSAIQCLSNTQALNEYFLNNKFLQEINEDNSLGTKGKLVREYGSLVQKLWSGQYDMVVPDSFKQLIENINPVFKGYQTHDCLEFIKILIDGIHEDLNRIKNKPYVGQIDSNGRPDFEVAKESWFNHKSRNQSIITDLMQGQNKIFLECPRPQCKYVSTIFDSFLTLTLNIPDNKKKFIQLKLYLNGFFDFTRKYIPFFHSQTYKLKHFKVNLERELNLVGKQLFFFTQLKNSSFEIFDEEQLMDDIKKLSDLSGLSVRQLTDFEASIPKVERIYIPFTNTVMENNSKKSLKQDGVLVFGKFYTLIQVHLQVFKMLKHLFLEILEGVVFQNDDQLLTFYEQNVLQKFYELDYKSNSSQIQKCSFCNKEICSNCRVQFDDESLNDVQNRLFESDSNYNIQFSIKWLLTEYINVQIPHLFDIINNNVRNQELYNQKEQKEQKDLRDQKEQKEQKEQPILTLKDCFEFSQLIRQQENDYSFYCKQCKDHVQGLRSIKIYKAPIILILQLKRFKTSKRVFKQISESFVEFPINGLDMSRYIINSRLPNDYVVENIQDNGEIKRKPVLYDLLAVINYYGGHYTAYAKNYIVNKWYNFDDSHVSEIINQDQIVSKAAYMLFYKLRDDNIQYQK